MKTEKQRKKENSSEEEIDADFSMITPYVDESDMGSTNEAFSVDDNAPWGFAHNGIDFFPIGNLKPFRAVSSGVFGSLTNAKGLWVEKVSLWQNDKTSNWQVNVVIKFNATYSVVYGFEPMTAVRTDGETQLANISVSVGQSLSQGDVIGHLYTGGEGAHVHFSLLKNHVAICPEKFFTPQARDSILKLIRIAWPGADICYGKQTKVIEDVERLQWGKGREDTFIGALTVAMRAMGEDVTYDYLMGVSGAAFRLHFHQPDWCPSSPDATCGFDHSEPAMKALGYTAYGIHSDKDNPEEVKKVRESVIQSIDKGHPVVAIDLINVPDWGVIVGYTDGGKEFLCRTYYDKTEKYSRAEKWPWVVEVIGEKENVPDHKESLLKSLKIAVELANTEKYGNYASGFAAYQNWATDLLDDSRFESLDEKELKSMNHTNAWCYNSLVDARESAVRYLRSIEKEFDKESAMHLSKSAKLYEEVVEKLKEGWEYAPFPWQLKGGKRWTKEMRHAEASVLKDVFALEKKAVDELKAALDSAKKGDQSHDRQER